MTRNRPVTLGFGILLAAAAAAFSQNPPTPARSEQKPIETFTCFGAQMERGRAGVIEFSIFRWSTDEERDRLLTTLQEFGQCAG